MTVWQFVVVILVFVGGYLWLQRPKNVDRLGKTAWRKYRLTPASQKWYFASTLISLIAALSWPFVAMRFADKNSLSGVLLVAVPAVAGAVAGAYCFLRLALDAVGAWLNGDD